MIEQIVIDYLSAHIGEPEGIPVKAELPADYGQERMIVVELLGASRDNRLPGAVVAAQCYAPSLYEAAALCEGVIEQMLRIPELPNVSWCSLNSAYNFTDEEMGRYRYQAVFELTYSN